MSDMPSLKGFQNKSILTNKTGTYLIGLCARCIYFNI